MKKRDLQILAYFRNNARETLTRVSKKTRMPISTIFDRLRAYNGDLITRHTSLLNFEKLGFSTRANIALQVKKDEKQSVEQFLVSHPNLNSVFKVNNGFDFLVEGIFRQIKEVEQFLETLDSKFSIKSKKVYYIIDEVKRESFMSDPDQLDLLFDCCS